MKASLLIPVAALLLSACSSNDVTVKSTIGKDGSIERSITFHDADSNLATRNLFGISEAAGWTLVKSYTVPDTVEVPDTTLEVIPNEDPELELTFTKKFKDVEEANNESDNGNDTLFQIRSELDRRYYFFFTDYYHADTYRPVDRTKSMQLEEFLSKEDLEHIRALPGRDQELSVEDSTFLQAYQEQRFGYYLVTSLFKENLTRVIDVMREAGRPQWQIDSLELRAQELIAAEFEGIEEPYEADLVLEMLDSLGVPLDEASSKTYMDRSEAQVPRYNFMWEASSTKFEHVIRMPGRIIGSNADSVRSRNERGWKPRDIQLIFTEYRMEAQSRVYHVWAIVVAGLVVIYLGWRALLRITNYELRGKKWK